MHILIFYYQITESGENEDAETRQQIQQSNISCYLNLAACHMNVRYKVASLDNHSHTTPYILSINHIVETMDVVY